MHTYCKTADDVCSGTCLRLLSDFLNMFVVIRCIMLCNCTDQYTNNQASDDSATWKERSKQRFGKNDCNNNCDHVCNVLTKFQCFMRIRTVFTTY